MTKSERTTSSISTNVKDLDETALSEEDQLELAFGTLPPHEAEILRRQLEIPTVNASFWALYRFCTPIDVVLLLLAVFFAIVEGAALPMFALVMGAITNNFQSFTTGEANPNDFTSIVNHNSLYYVYIGIAIMGSGFLESFLFVTRGEIIACRYRKNYIRAILRQNIAYFDRLGTGTVSTRITNNTSSIQEAISEKAGQIIKCISCFVAALVIALATQWKLALIVLSLVIWIIISVGVTSSFFIKHTVVSDSIYTKGSNVADEAFSAIRNTIALGAQSKLVDRFDSFLQKSRKKNDQATYYLSAMLASLWGTLGFIYAISFWEGSRLVAWGQTDIGDIIVVFVALLVGAFQMSAMGPLFRYIASGVSGAKVINETIVRIPAIDSEDNKGEKLDQVQGRIDFKNVRFRYPSRPTVLVLPDFSLTVEPGHTVALVGASGSGKSTIIGILERFYEILSGSVTIDGTELRDLNLKWLRQQIGLVSQEPTLFANTIAENVAQGLIGTPYEHADPEKKLELVVEACKLSNAWDFINTLTDGIDTNVGDKGFLLSGGQKQRIAIARAIVSNPKILLLDEATSALDTKSEGIVQDALDRAAKSRTTIVIAHRLSTVKDADVIVVMSAGEIIESGTHSELLAKKGAYHRLVNLQQVEQGHDDTEGSGKPLTDDPAKIIQEDEFVHEDDENVDISACHIPGLDPVEVSVRKIVRLLWGLNKNERIMLIVSFMLAVTVGYAQDGYAMLIGKSSEALMTTPAGYSHMRSTINLTSWMFFLVGMHQVIAGFLLILLLCISAGHLLRNVRLALFKQLLRMDVSFFDHEENTAGALTSMLAKDGKAIEGLGGATFGQILQCVVMVVGGAVTGIAFNWRLGLVGTACIPILIGCGYFRLKVLERLEERTRKVYEGSASLASSFTSAVRTVQFLTREEEVCKAFDNAIDRRIGASFYPTVLSAAVFALAEGLIPWVFALIWWYGSGLLRDGKITVYAYYVVFIGVIFGAQAAGQGFNYAPDVGKAKSAAGNILRMLEAKPLIDTWSTEGIKITNEEVKGEIEFKDVYFRYPTRPQVPVLRGVSIKVKPGQYAALVGASGCGKSTSIGLCERFYDPLKGQVLFDGIDLKDYNVNSLRQCIALVQQEPMLYSGTIRDNILLGWTDDNTESVTQEMITTACKKANIHDFIVGLPNGYDTEVGAAGGLLSGGQKQRIAIARVMIRNPPVLLLDEATSALDAESEKAVQAALDNVAEGRTILSVAHRLSTIQNADIIYVFDRGRIVETGTHKELLSMNGRYAELVRLQSLENNQ